MAKKADTSFEKGRAAYWQGKLRKPTNDGAFMQQLVELTGNTSRAEKSERVESWKAGWDAAKAEDEAAKAPKKKTKKKTSKK